MAKNLMIVESPAKAKTIEKYLGKDFTVRASYGHVRDLPKADDAINVEDGFKPKYEVLKDKKDVIKELKKLCKESEMVWLATDEDREGEAISWHLAEVLGLDQGTAKRVVFNEITKTAVTRAIDNPRPINQDLVAAQQARRVLDRLVGFKLSPILWKKVKGGLSAGRVQSVAVRLIVERERDIVAFEPESRYKVTANFDLGNGVVLKGELGSALPSLEAARKFLDECNGAVFSIDDLVTKPAKKSPAAPFTTSTLQQEASRKLSFSVAQTMRIAQGLYEAGHITYMRTDSVNLSDFAMGAIGNVVEKQYGENYHQPRKFKSKGNNAQEAHEAIRPTNVDVLEAGVDRNERRLYELIWKRTVASQMADAKLEKTTATIGVSKSDRNFLAKGEVLKFDGFLKVYLEGRDDEDEEEKSGVLPPLSVGQELSLIDVEAKQRFSRPPARFTEASLVKKLEELGIGRPSTYAPTISTVQRRNYVVKETRDGKEREVLVLSLKEGQIDETAVSETFGAEKAKLFPTDLGMLVTDFLTANFPKVLDYSFTARVEAEFDKVAEGGQKWVSVIEDFYQPFQENLAETADAERAKLERVLGDDPKTGQMVMARWGKYGPYVLIGDPEGEEKPKYASLRSNQRIETITLEEALELFKLPRVLGASEDGTEIRANVGRFGPYVQEGKTFASIPKEEDPMTITLERALVLIKEKKEAAANRIIKELAEDCQVLRGRYGPYVKMRGKNLRIPKDVEPESLTMDDCEKLFEEQKNKPKRGGGRKKAAAKKTTAKKTTAKKTTAKKTTKKPAAKKKK